MQKRRRNILCHPEIKSRQGERQFNQSTRPTGIDKAVEIERKEVRELRRES